MHAGKSSGELPIQLFYEPGSWHSNQNAQWCLYHHAPLCEKNITLNADRLGTQKKSLAGLKLYAHVSRSHTFT